jgi:hypothetical protein
LLFSRHLEEVSDGRKDWQLVDIQGFGHVQGQISDRFTYLLTNYRKLYFLVDNCSDEEHCAI